MASNQRRYCKFAIRTYADKEQCIEIMEKRRIEGRLKGYALCLHDKDVDEQGNRKVPHTHIVVVTETSIAKTTVEKWFNATTDFKGEIANHRVEVESPYKEGSVVYVKGATFYLVHEETNGNPKPNKYHYSWDEVVAFNLDLLKSYEDQVQSGVSAKEDRTFDILDDMLRGRRMLDMAKEYGRDFILNYRKYQELALSIALQEERIEEFAQEGFVSAWLDGSGDATETIKIATKETKEAKREIETLKAILVANGIEY